MNTSELDITFTNADVDGLLDALQRHCARRGWHLRVRERELAGPASTVWGRFIGDQLDWADAREEAGSGLGRIEGVTTPDGVRPALVYDGPFRAATLAAIAERGEPVFEVASHLVEASISWSLDVPSLHLSIEHASRSSLRVAGTRNGVALLDRVLSWALPAGAGRGIGEHVTAVEICDLIADYAELDLFDTTGYVEHRDDAFAVAAAAHRRFQLHQLSRAIHPS